MLFVSFWKLALSNLPAGSFTTSAISAHEAAARIASARSEAQLLCVSAEDLLAPYKRRAYEKQFDLCSALAALDVVLSVEDFLGSNCCNPLELARVGAGKSLLIVDCAYTYDFVTEPSARKGRRFRFEILPGSITFNLIQKSGSADAVFGLEIETAKGSADLESDV